MQIGADSKHLPGCAPVPQTKSACALPETPARATMPLAPLPVAERERHFRNRAIYVVWGVGLLLMAVVGAYAWLKHDRFRQVGMTQISRPSRDKAANQVMVASPALAVSAPLAAPVVEPATTSSIAKPKPLLVSAADHVVTNVLATENVVAWPTIKLTAIIGGPHTKSFARVNGKLVTLGDTVESMTVAAISTQCVTLICKGQHRDFYVGDRDDCK